MAKKTHGDLAADAAAYLAGSADPTSCFGGDTKEIDRQAVCLIKWARSKNAILGDDYTSSLERHSGVSAEHEVFFRESDDRVVKRTYPGTFGISDDPKGKQHHATPMFYLRRLELMNQIFGADLRVEGVSFGTSLLISAKGEQPSLVVSQPWIRAANPKQPHPTPTEIREFMESLGFTELMDAYYGWHRKSDNLTVLDARPDNFVLSAVGVIPIDLVISQPNSSPAAD
jgi:hypothetical protein